MDRLLEFFSLSEAVSLIMLIGVLWFVGTQCAGNDATLRWWARGFAVVGFLSYGTLAIATWKPCKPSEFLPVGFQALLAMGMVHGLTLVTLPFLQLMYLHLWTIPQERRRTFAEQQKRRAEFDQEERQRAEQKQLDREWKEEQERRLQVAIANRPPPPTQTELITAAQERYEEALRLLAKAGLDDTELQAARERAKQKYLRDLDAVMK